jgi:hypothetical protein
MHDWHVVCRIRYAEFGTLRTLYVWRVLVRHKDNFILTHIDRIL